MTLRQGGCVSSPGKNGESEGLSASCAEALGSSSARTSMLRGAATDASRIYVETVLDRYLWLPGTPKQACRLDRVLARKLYERGVSIDIIQAALVLGAARRAFRPRDAPPLPPIRTLHYFLPLIDEVLHDSLAPGYVTYLESKLQPLADVKLAQG
jgi:hypothetical protein